MALLLILLCPALVFGSASPFFGFLDLDKSLGNSDKFISAGKESYEKNYQALQQELNSIKEDTANMDDIVPKLPDDVFGKVASGLYDKAKNVSKGVVNKATNSLNKVTATGINIMKSLTAATCNTGADFMLEELRIFLSTFNKDKIVLPPFETDYSTWLTTIKFRAGDGHFGKLTSLGRTKTVDFQLLPQAIVINIPVSFGELEAGYDYINISNSLTSFAGGCTVSIKSNELMIRLRLSVDFGCALNVESVTITELEGIDIQFNGLGKQGDALVKYVSSSIANYMKDTIKEQVQSSINNALTSYLNNNQLVCSKFIPV